MTLVLLEHAEAYADGRGMEKPEGLVWALKAVQADLTSGYDAAYRWPFPGGWAECSDPLPENKGPCPSRPGDGLCVAKTWRGMASGGLPARVLLLVGYRENDVLGYDKDKARVRRAFVRDVIDGERLVREHGAKAYLYGANLSRANLSRANLYGADLRGANLSRANLYGADLSTADLYGANLSRANLRGANLSRANLSTADLSTADLRGADLHGADLNGAALSRAALRRADLRRANLRGADLYRADLTGADLRGALADSRTVWPAGFDAQAAGVVA